jgi:hypothetical protein
MNQDHSAVVRVSLSLPTNPNAPKKLFEQVDQAGADELVLRQPLIETSGHCISLN